MSLPKEVMRGLFHQMLRIRRVQLHIESLYHLDEMKTPIHLSIGQEAVAVGVSAHLRKEDFIQSNHRSHGHYLAKGGDLKALIAELYCRSTGCSKGFGGSMHLVDVSVGHMGSSSIVGGGIPIGTGLALSIAMKKENRVSVVYFSDGAADEGVLYESVNFAILKRLPVIYVYENNQYSVCSPVSARQAYDNIFHQAPPDMMASALVDGNDVFAVYDAAKAAVERARKGAGPSFLECRTYRMRGHAGSYSDAKLGYRTEEEIASWEAKDPVERLESQLLEQGVIDENEIARLEERIHAEIEEAFAFAQSSPLPGRDDLHRYLFREKEHELCPGPR